MTFKRDWNATKPPRATKVKLPVQADKVPALGEELQEDWNVRKDYPPFLYVIIEPNDGYGIGIARAKVLNRVRDKFNDTKWVVKIESFVFAPPKMNKARMLARKEMTVHRFDAFKTKASAWKRVAEKADYHMRHATQEQERLTNVLKDTATYLAINTDYMVAMRSVLTLAEEKAKERDRAGA